MNRPALYIFLVGLLLMPSIGNSRDSLPDSRTLRQWIQAMKASPQGPFKRIRWFCRDGTVQPPIEYACSERGGGVQHGEWNDRVKTLRENGFYIANLLADLLLEEPPLQPPETDFLKQIILEQFLINSDDGWIFRDARYYRGALQAEDEAAGGNELLLTLTRDPYWSNTGFTVLREAVRLLPHHRRGAPITEMRQLTLAIDREDQGFRALRIKIHVKPDAGDAQRVRDYAVTRGLPELADDYMQLAELIDEVYRHREIEGELLSLAEQVRDPNLYETLRGKAKSFANQDDPSSRLATAGELLAMLRDNPSRVGKAPVMLATLDASLELEHEVFLAGHDLLEHLNQATRRERLRWLEGGAAALYGTGLISLRQWQHLQRSFARLTEASPSLPSYKAELDYVARVSEWANRRLYFNFSQSVDHIATLEPLVHNYIHDRLHGSPLLFYATVLEGLQKDANRLLGIGHEFFGETLGGGIRGLNPGLARGNLRFPPREGSKDRYHRGDIYVLPATTADLPPLAGIVTAGEGNSLSHVQLLARNLGIPNVVVEEDLLPRLAEKIGLRVVLAVSPNGAVRLVEDGPEWQDILAQDAGPPEVPIRVDPARLNLGQRDIIPLEHLRAPDSERIVGPKAANLGELRRRFPKAVPPALVIPFGVFRELLDRPLGPGGPPMSLWMKEQYTTLQAMKSDPEVYQEATARFLKQVRNWIIQTDPGHEFRDRLRVEMKKLFGPDNTYGVFVRSDTNVEDLPGFTGAGLNLTVPNVVGFDNVLEAIKRVWASPFTERAFTWRQANMQHPEQLFVSVLLMRSIPAQKSGVMVTTHLESGRLGWLSVAVNEGVGGAVDGQAAEELRINMRTGGVRLMSHASEPLKRVLLPSGGITKARTSGTEAVLQEEEITQLIDLAETVFDHYPMLDAEGCPVPADIEFGFQNGRLVLFQIRPFLESTHARHNRFLTSLDRQLYAVPGRTVDLDKIPPEE
jgi:hypothetical protein